MSPPDFDPHLTEERLARALKVYAVTGPGWFITALVAEVRLLRHLCREQAARLDELQRERDEAVAHRDDDETMAIEPSMRIRELKQTKEQQ